MDFQLTDEQRLIRDSAVRLVQENASADRGPDHLWQSLFDSGYLSLLVPAAHGGSGLGFLEAGLVLEALGATLVATPYCTSAVVAADWLRRHGSASQQELWLPRMASGEVIAAPLLRYDGSSAYGEPRPGGIRVSGHSAPVSMGSTADIYLVEIAPRRPGENLAVIVERSQPGVVVEDLALPDLTRLSASVTLTEVEVTEDRIMRRCDGRWLWSAAAACKAAEMLGGAGQALEIAAAYARERKQFGVPIGSFQGIKHMLADQVVMLEGTRSAVYAALWALDNDPARAECSCALAKLKANECYTKTAGESIQIHGALGFSEEALPHRYLKRALVDSHLFGTAEAHLGTLADNLEQFSLPQN